MINEARYKFGYNNHKCITCVDGKEIEAKNKARQAARSESSSKPDNCTIQVVV